MNFKRALMLILTFALLFSLAACGNEETGNENNPFGGEQNKNVDKNDPLYGEWVEIRIPEDGFGTTYEFYGNGKGEYRTLDLVNYYYYTYDGEKLRLEILIDNPPIVKEYNCKIEGGKLILDYTTDSGEAKTITCNKK